MFSLKKNKKAAQTGEHFSVSDLQCKGGGGESTLFQIKTDFPLGNSLLMVQKNKETVCVGGGGAQKDTALLYSNVIVLILFAGIAFLLCGFGFILEQRQSEVLQ